MHYILISPVRNEAKNIEATLRSVVQQTVRPVLWMIVDDGSTDGTQDVVKKYAAHHSWIKVMQLVDRGYYDLMDAGELKAFLGGLDAIQGVDYAFIGKLDGDISFGPDYYADLLQRFAQNPALGIASGVCRHEENDKPVVEKGYPLHVRGAMRIYRKTCWDMIGGAVRSLGWDAIDCYKARMFGWETRSFEDLPVNHHVKTWTKGGLLHGRRRSGRMEYLIGTHPFFFLAKCLREMAARPYVISAGALCYGYLYAALRREKRVCDGDLLAYVRKEQWGRITRRLGIRR